jgi:nucleotide-binding universal stress UspA family protein
VAEGHPLDAVLEAVRKHDVDLVIASKTNRPGFWSSFAERLVRRAPCSVLSIPGDAEPQLGTILVAVDFSEHAKDALRLAITLARAARLKELSCLHAAPLPLRYQHTGRTHEQLSALIREHADGELQEMIAELSHPDVRITPLLEVSTYVAEVIRDQARADHADLLVLGARGRSAGASLLLGSVTEELLRTTDCPLLAYKKKGEGMRFLDALLGR